MVGFSNIIAVDGYSRVRAREIYRETKIKVCIIIEPDSIYLKVIVEICSNKVFAYCPA